ncbi:MAG TPA: PmoA family protein [Candidatus Hydrogenedentes bacterium]|nr:PmoA family protein [Candidatus Hydrogenedentota bacterium]HNT86825.1 PmoA family protein [Candidatus Hydrogenedentota bacterium]
MRHFTFFSLPLLALAATACAAQDAPEPPFQDGVDLVVFDAPWLRTITPTYERRDHVNTYKVFTHVYDFDGVGPITKGPGGLYTHHRGLFIGWKDTLVDGTDFDTWSMDKCYQQHVAWLAFGNYGASTFQRQKIEWRDPRDTPFIEEIRTITATLGDMDVRIVDFGSRLTSLRGTIQLKGDLQHAGMHIRMAQEVVEHQDTTRYILPEGAEEREGDEVVGAWWVCASVVVRDKRYWVMHMSPRELPGGVPVYSIRRYARFGAFFEPTLEEGRPLDLTFRLVFSERELDRARCQALYDEFTEDLP